MAERLEAQQVGHATVGTHCPLCTTPYDFPAAAATTSAMANAAVRPGDSIP